MTRCPLCDSPKCSLYYSDAQRKYIRCTGCSLVFVPKRYHISAAQEKAEYDLHENSMQDQGYRRFLSRLCNAMLSRLDDKGLIGLDYGCGAAPLLAELFKEGGYTMHLYDPFYFPDGDVLTKKYDFICLSEVVEHFRNPGEEFKKLSRLLKNGGLLGIMTKMIKNHDAFQNWHYIRDKTHICFFHHQTFHYLADLFHAELSIEGADIILLRNHE